MRIGNNELPFSDGFESGDFTAGGWVVSGGASIVDSPVASGSKAAKGTNAYSLTKNFTAASSGTLDFTVKFNVAQTNKNACAIELMSGADPIVLVFPRWKGTIESYDGPMDNILNSKVIYPSYTANTWYTIRIVADLATSKFDVYVDDIIKASRFNFALLGRSIDNIVIASGESSGSIAYLDDIQLSNVQSDNPVPTLASLSSASAMQGQTLNVVLTGTGYINASTVGFGSGITINSTTVSSSTQITVNITIAVTATLGTRDVTVTNPTPGGGTATRTGGFTVTLPDNPVPTLTSLSSASGQQGQTLNVVLTGTGYINASTVGFGSGITINSTTVSSSTQITVNITIAVTATLGTRDVTVTNPTPGGGTATRTGGFTVTLPDNPVPTLTSLSSASGQQGQTLNVVLTGTGYINASTVGFGSGITINSTTVSSSTQITVNITIAVTATLGTRDVTVTNPGPGGGTATKASGFTVTLPDNPVPTLTSLSSASGQQGQTLDVVLTGSGYVSASTVGIGSGITINSKTVNSSTQITVNITIAATATLGTRDVTVTNPAPGGGTATRAGGFTVTPVINTLAVSQTSWSAPAAGGTSTAVNVTNTGGGGAITYTISDDATWLTTSVTNGTTPGSFTMTATANPGTARTAVVTVTATTPSGVTESPRLLNVTQSGLGPVTSVVIDTVSVSSVGEAIIIPIQVQKFSDISAISLKINYDNVLLTYNGLDSPPLGTLVNTSSGNILISWQNPTPISLNDGDQLLGIKLNYNGGLALGQVSPISFVVAMCEVSNSAGTPISSAFIDGAIKLSDAFKISGILKYKNAAQTPISGVTVKIASTNGVFWS